MDDPSARTRPCDNCKRDIPEDNFTIHSVYCCRNLRICKQCKEPVAIADMEKHTAQVPCSQCGETMQACDIPAHKTDACSLTQVHCTYCELSLERAAMGDHELYCGSRTEKCPECSELILIKYKKLHEESNHSFLKLDDEPGPQPSWEVKASKSSAKSADKPRNQIEKKHRSDRSHSKREQNTRTVLGAISQPSSSFFSNSSNINYEPEKPIQLPPISRGAIKKRIAPQPPTNSNSPKTPDNVAVLKPFKHTRDVPMYKAIERKQVYKKELDLENEFRAANNLPLLLNPLEKIEKLRKMSALQNMELDNNEYKSGQKEKQPSKSQRAKVPNEETNQFPIKNTDNVPKTKKNVNVKADKNNKVQFFDYSDEQDALVPARDNFSHNSNIDKNYDKGMKYSSKPLKLDNFDAANQIVSIPSAILPDNACSQNFSNIPKRDKNEINYKTSNKKNKIEFLEYSDNLDTFIPTNANPVNESNNKPVDRFCDIKNDLQALRKELKKCSSPLESRHQLTRNTDNNVPTRSTENAIPSPLNLNIPNPVVENCGPLDLYKITNDVQSHQPVDLPPDEDVDGLNFVMLPCEFCEQMIQASSLVAHETGCRPNITSFANDKNSFNNLCENAAPPNTPDGHHTPKLSNVNIYNEKQVKKKLRESEMNIREPSSPESNQSTVIVPPEEEIDEAAGDLDEVKLPCEFCMTLVPACRLVWHQEACYAA